MKDETRTWLSYADENLMSQNCPLLTDTSMPASRMRSKRSKKYLKAVIVERDLEFRRTHSIRELLGLLAAQGIALSVSEDEMDLMDSIYIPSKYPVYSALPQALPDPGICRDALAIAKKVKDHTTGILKVAHPKS